MAGLSDYDAVHRELWPAQRVHDETFREAPFLGLIRKREDFLEKTRHIALQYGRPQGRSRTFATAKSRASASRFADFEIKSADDYGYGEIEGKLLESVRNDPAALVDAMERETRSALGTLKRSLHINAFGSGAGDRGSISSIAESGGNTTITLSEPADAKNFEVDQYITAGATLTGALRDSAAAYKVISVDLSGGTVKVSGTAATTSLWAAGDYLFSDGDALNGGTITGLSVPMVAGLQGWIPATAPSSGDSWFGVDRSVDVVRLAGWRFTASGLGGATTIRATLQRAAAAMSRAGLEMSPDIAVLNSEDYGDLLEEMDDKNTVVRESSDLKARIAYTGVEVHTAVGKLDVFADPQCPKGRAFILRADTWTLHSLGMAPKFIEHDGMRVLRTDTDAVEFRMVYRAQLACDAPAYNATVSLP